MRARVGVVGPTERTAADVAAQSRGALDRPLRSEAELTVSVIGDDALVCGAFQRAAGRAASAAWPESVPLLRRGSGGPEVWVGPGTVHVELVLEHPAVMLHADPRRIVNRAVRPLLRALSKRGHAAAFFGRDWVSVAHSPAAWVGFAHDAGTRRTVFEAFVAVATPFAVNERASFRGKAPATLVAIAGRAVDAAGIAEAIVEAYAEGHDPFPLAAAAPAGPVAGGEGQAAADDPRADPPWAATTEEAIGPIGAGPDVRGVFRVGGDLMVSRDALGRLEAAVAGVAPQASLDDVGGLVDEALGGAGVALDGVRTLASVRDVIARALPRSAPP